MQGMHTLDPQPGGFDHLGRVAQRKPSKMAAVEDSSLIRSGPSSLDEESAEDAPVANVWQAYNQSPTGVEGLDGSIEDRPRFNQMLENVSGHDAVELAQGREHVAPARQVVQVQAMNIVQPRPSILCVRGLELDSRNAPNSLLFLEAPPSMPDEQPRSRTRTACGGTRARTSGRLPS